jgi:hypothetical protein
MFCVVAPLLLAEQQAAQQSQAIKMFSALLSQNSNVAAAAAGGSAAQASAGSNPLEVSTALFHVCTALGHDMHAAGVTGAAADVLAGLSFFRLPGKS